MLVAYGHPECSAPGSDCVQDFDDAHLGLSDCISQVRGLVEGSCAPVPQ